MTHLYIYYESFLSPSSLLISLSPLSPFFCKVFPWCIARVLYIFASSGLRKADDLKKGETVFLSPLPLLRARYTCPLFHRSALWNQTEIVLKVALFLNSFSPCLSAVAFPHSTFINPALWIKNKDNTGSADLSKTNLLHCFGQTHNDKQRIVKLIHHDLFS